MRKLARVVLLGIGGGLVCGAMVQQVVAQRAQADAGLIARRNATEKELESIAIIERKVMVPMRDGKRMQADIYRPKDESKKYPVIFSRTPYNFNYWDVELGAPRDMTTELEAVKHGYAYIEMNERGRFFSEGDYDILGAPLTDADDALAWMGGLPWSADKVGSDWVFVDGGVAVECGFARGQGAGGVYSGELWRGRGTGGAVLRAGQLVSRRRGADAVYCHGCTTKGYDERGQAELSRRACRKQALVTAAKSYDLSAHPPPVDWVKGAVAFAGERSPCRALARQHGIFADTTPTGSRE